MILVALFCSGILTTAPGCREERVVLFTASTPQQCSLAAQQVLGPGGRAPTICRCERRHQL